MKHQSNRGEYWISNVCQKTKTAAPGLQGGGAARQSHLERERLRLLLSLRLRLLRDLRFLERDLRTDSGRALVSWSGQPAPARQRAMAPWAGPDLERLRLRE